MQPPVNPWVEGEVPVGTGSGVGSRRDDDCKAPVPPGVLALPMSCCGEETSDEEVSIDGDAPKDGDAPADGDAPTDGDAPKDGDVRLTVERDTLTDGDANPRGHAAAWTARRRTTRGGGLAARRKNHRSGRTA